MNGESVSPHPQGKLSQTVGIAKNLSLSDCDTVISVKHASVLLSLLSVEVHQSQRQGG